MKAEVDILAGFILVVVRAVVRDDDDGG